VNELLAMTRTYGNIEDVLLGNKYKKQPNINGRHLLLAT
jgi:hypothetical protein